MKTPLDHRADPKGRGRDLEIAEFQGLYGTYNVSEILLQRIWLKGEFDGMRARLLSGEALRVRHPGTWNRLGGPDFRGAELEIDGRPVKGDVELHFRADAWRQHGHENDPAYDNVVLHVVLFPPPDGVAPAVTRAGRPVPVLVLVDLLWHDLEEYAADDVVAALSGRDPLPVVEHLLGLTEARRERVLCEAASARWRQKVYFAQLRCDRLGWDEACHQTALEILGYSSNRIGMLRVATRFPWSTWSRKAPRIEELTAVGSSEWEVRGVRPANHPRARLAQYHAWMARVPDWPAALRKLRRPDFPGTLDEIVRDPGRARRTLGLPAWREAVAGEICGGQLHGARLDTLICNLVLPFLAVGGDDAAHPLWLVWYAGDLPDNLLAAARHLRRPDGRTVRTNGLFQGLLGLQIALEK